MKKTILIDCDKTPDGSDVSLHMHDGAYKILVDGHELMSTRQQYSERHLAEIVCNSYQNRNITVLVGGLGFGFTLQAVLESISLKSRVLVVELLPCVVRWNLNPQFPLAHKHLKDRRVTLVQDDVYKVICNKTAAFDAIILDVDNGPEAFTVEANDALYSRTGLTAIYRALNKGGTLGVWSARPSPQFEKTLKASNFQVETHKVRAREHNKGAVHTLFIANKNSGHHDLSKSREES